MTRWTDRQVTRRPFEINQSVGLEPAHSSGRWMLETRAHPNIDDVTVTAAERDRHGDRSGVWTREGEEEGVSGSVGGGSGWRVAGRVTVAVTAVVRLIFITVVVPHTISRKELGEQGWVTLSCVCLHCHRYICWVSLRHGDSGLKKKNQCDWWCAASGGQYDTHRSKGVSGPRSADWCVRASHVLTQDLGESASER